MLHKERELKEINHTWELVVSVDTGGTFTDFIYEEDGRLNVFKIVSSPDDPSRAVFQGLDKITSSKRRRVIHGSTVATNALLERKGAITAVITNKGFEDVLEIGRQTRSRLYDLSYVREEPLVPRELRLGLNCRVDSGGSIINDLDETELSSVITALQDGKVESVAICFLFSFLNPSHELLVEKVLEDTGIEVSMSSRVLPEFREYERLSTTAVNAYVKPVMRKYIDRLAMGIDENNLSIMQSNGGRVSANTASDEPVRTILSGPAGGVVGAWAVAQSAGFSRIISFDMGGTSTDVSLVDGELPITTDTKIAGLPVKTPTIDIHTVGAGGGSIAVFDEGGALRVGPDSAGADPGPVCYGKGGSQPTVSDANLILGRLLPQAFLGGTMKLVRSPVEEAFLDMARPRGMSIEELAEGICTVANSNMERALRGVSVEKGHNPQDFVLVSFGGAAAMHAAFLASSLGIPSVMIPQNPGTLSAMGMLLSDVIKDYSITVMKDLSEASEENQENVFAELEGRARNEMKNEGFHDGNILIERYLDLRYKGQSYELIVPHHKDQRSVFHSSHKKTYGHCDESRDIEVVNFRIRAIGIMEKPRNRRQVVSTRKASSKSARTCIDVVFDGVKHRTEVFERGLLMTEQEIAGPAVVTEYSSTTVIPPGFLMTTDSYGNMFIDCMGRS